MASYDNAASWLSNSPPRRDGHYRINSFLLSQEEHTPVLPSRGQGVLTHLLRNRSHTSLHSYGSAWGRSSGPEDEESAIAHDSLSDEPSRRLHQDERRLSQILQSTPMRSMRLIGNSNLRYKWARYWKTEEQLSEYSKPLREYYERTNYLIQQYLYIDRLLDSSLPHDLVNEYNDLPYSSFKDVDVPDTITEEPGSLTSLVKANVSVTGALVDATDSSSSPRGVSENDELLNSDTNTQASRSSATKKVKRTPRDIYRATETTPLFNNDDDEHVDGESPKPEVPWPEEDDDLDSGDRIVALAIYVNFAANVFLLAGKIAVVISMSSMSVLASLVDAVLDFLSTVIVWITTWLISRQDQYKYPVGRRRLEPLGVLVFSVIMITSFTQVALESINRLLSPDHELIEVGIPALGIMIGTVLIKGLCWLWCRLVKNSSVQALAADAMTDVIFNMGSILFPITGFYLKIWWLDALGGLVLSLVVIINWSQTSLQHIKNLSGFSATADQRNVLLYLTMRFAKTIKQIQGLQAYHAGDKLNVEVDIILDASTTLRDSHDLSESLGYVLESVPMVDRAFVHADYASYNLPTHMEQQSG
ncbi:hypothetical protein F4775DRAFT_548188 [Biscogniauxia sp. FL1348]|nr:hypothetical protein F4775DRAFT_548188 [Biscogniauxia sp. FL1348]